MPSLVSSERHSDPSRDGQEEVDIVLNTWLVKAAVPGLDIVAVADGQIVGHLLERTGVLTSAESLEWPRWLSFLTARARALGQAL